MGNQVRPSELCGCMSPEDGLRPKVACVRPKGHSRANGLGDYHGTEVDLYGDNTGYFWHEESKRQAPPEPPTHVRPTSLLAEMAEALWDARERLYGGEGSATEIGARITQLLARYKDERKLAAVPEAKE